MGLTNAVREGRPKGSKLKRAGMSEEASFANTPGHSTFDTRPNREMTALMSGKKGEIQFERQWYVRRTALITRQNR